MKLMKPAALLVALAVLSGGSAAAGSSGATGEMVSVIVTLREQAALGAIGGSNRPARLHGAIVALQATADRTQTGIRAVLEARRAQGQVAEVIPYWVFNGLAVTATKRVIEELALRPEVQSITPNRSFEAPVTPASFAAPELNIDVVNAPDLWSLGYRGQGVVVANMDSGVDVSHPDLASRWRGGSNSWYDPNGQHPTTPTDVGGHGTWTMGVMVGGDAGGSAVGIAPDAKWIAVKIFDDQGRATTSRIHQGFQWLLDPDQNASTPDAPNVVNNSWSFGSPGCNLEFQLDLRSLRAAGILPVFAAGNFGPGSSTSTSPGNNPEAFAVGATDNADAVWASSGRGPSACGEPQTTYPEVVAPGIDIRTTDLFGLYRSLSGTSMSAPHVAGALALLLDAFPNLTAGEQAGVLESGARDLGPAGPDNTYGHGRLDVLGAYNSLAATPDFAIAASPGTASTGPGGTVTYSISVAPVGGFSGDVALSLTGLSATQATSSFTPQTIAGGSGSSQLSITTAASLAPGSYPLTITGTSGSLSHAVPVTLVVVSQAADFGLTVSPASRTVTRGFRTTYTVTVSSSGGFAGTVSLSGRGLPSGTFAWFAPSSVVAPGSSTLTVRAGPSAVLGTYTLTVTGKSGSLTHQAAVTLTVT